MKNLVPIVLAALLVLAPPALAEEGEAPTDGVAEPADPVVSEYAGDDWEEGGQEEAPSEDDAPLVSADEEVVDAEIASDAVEPTDSITEPSEPSAPLDEPEPTGWQDSDGIVYYIDPSTGERLSGGIFEIDGERYCFDSEGALVTGWLELDGSIFYLDPADGRLYAGGIFEVDGGSYYFRPAGSPWGPEGSMGRGWVRGHGDPAADYFFDRTTGRMVTGEALVDGRPCLFGADGAAAEGWVERDGFSFLYSGGAMLSGGIFEAGGGSYYLRPAGSSWGPEGSRGAGWVRGHEGNDYFFDRSDGHMYEGGIFEVDGGSYYFRPAGSPWGPAGSMGRGWVRGYGDPAEDYFFDRSTGRMARGRARVDGSAYFFDPATGAVRTGWIEDGGRTYYAKEGGRLCSGEIYEVDGESYYFRPAGSPWGPEGSMGRGWVRGYGDPAEDYFFDRTTGRLFTLVSTGNSELDRILWAMVDRFGANGSTSLRAVYDWVATFPYTSMNLYPGGSWQSWSIPYAIEMYSNHTGNCYRYASLTCWFARALGYEAKTVSGQVLVSSGWAAHGWVEINQGGKIYIIDTSQHRAAGSRNFFMVDYDSAPLYYRKLS